MGNEDVTYTTFTEMSSNTKSLNVTRTKDGCSTVLIIRGHTSVLMVNEYISMVAVIKTLQYYLRLVHFSTSMCLYILNSSPTLSHSSRQNLTMAPSFHLFVIHHSHITTPHNIHGHLRTTASQNVDFCLPPLLSSSLFSYPSISLLTLDTILHNKVLNISITTSPIIK
jgi:hypothetical protein